MIMPDTSPSVVIIIVNWNNYDATRTCLDTLATLTYPNYEIILVDNGSQNDSSQRLVAEFPAVHLVEIGDNLGFAAGNNAGFRYAQSLPVDYYLLLNNDTEVINPTFLDSMVGYAQETTEAGVIGPLVRLTDGSIQPTMGYFPTVWNAIYYGWLHRPIASADTINQVLSLSGVCLLIKKEALDQAGMFDENFFMYAEEHELLYRIRQANWQVHYLPVESVIHYHGLSSSKMPGKFYTMRRANNLYLLAKHRFITQAWLTLTLYLMLHTVRLIIARIKGSSTELPSVSEFLTELHYSLIKGKRQQ